MHQITRLAIVFLSSVLLTCAWAQPTRLSLQRGNGPVQISLDGETNREYTIESATGSVDTNNWQFLLTTPLVSRSQPWYDSASAAVTNRFYRAVKLEPASPSPVDDFRLIDHQGRSQSLYYQLNNAAVPAIVIIFAGNDCTKLQQFAPVINALTNRFRPRGILFWMIDANATDNRSNIAAQATALGLNIPILHDRAQIVAHAFKATTTAEAIALNKTVDMYGATQWSVFYRGSIDDRLGPSPVATTQYYLSNALENVLASRPVAPSRTVPAGCDITFNPTQAVSYATDIAPLLAGKCVRCHSPGNIAPFAMTEYSVVQLWSQAIRAEVLARRMPPWHADYNFLPFTNDFSLAPADVARLVQWIDDGSPRGSGPDPLAIVQPPQTNFPYAWPSTLGQPDQVVTIPVQTVSGYGSEPYHYVTVTVNVPSNRWVRAAIARPGNVPIVHHVLIYSGANSQLQGMDGYFSGYVPGYEAAAFPDNTAKLMTNGTRLTFQIHYIRNGSNNTDQTQLGLYYQPVAPTYVLQTKSAYNFLFSIPPNNPDYETTASYTFSRAANLYEMSPHMHLRGARFKYEAVYTNGARETLLNVPFYEFHWQTLYRLAQPKFLPAGTRIVCTGAWDNSALNPDNPDPNATVGFGEQTENEMFIGYFNFAELP